MKRLVTRVVAVVLGVVIFTVTALGDATAATPQKAAHAPSAAAAANPFQHHIAGKSKNGARFSGTFTTQRFVHRPGRIVANGLMTGTLTRPGGQRASIHRHVNLPTSMHFVGRQVGAGARAAQAAAAAGTCRILNLVLGPLNLNLLGLVVHLNRVHLVINARTGPGNLLGNLLCAVANLLNGVNLNGLLGRVTRLLNRILNSLG
jgi:hypothetical protein